MSILKRVGIAIINWLLIVTMPLWGGLTMFIWFSISLVRGKDPQMRNMASGKEFLF